MVCRKLAAHTCPVTARLPEEPDLSQEKCVTAVRRAGCLPVITESPFPKPPARRPSHSCAHLLTCHHPRHVGGLVLHSGGQGISGARKRPRPSGLGSGSAWL